MLDQVDRLPRSEREFTVQKRICSELAVSMVLICAGMSSGPSVSWSIRRSRASRPSAVIKSLSTDGSAFSWIVSRRRGMADEQRHRALSRARLLHKLGDLAVRSTKPRPGV